LLHLWLKELKVVTQTHHVSQHWCDRDDFQLALTFSSMSLCYQMLHTIGHVFLRFKVVSVLLSCFSFFSRIDSLPELLIHLQHKQPMQDYAYLCNKHSKPAKHLLQIGAQRCHPPGATPSAHVQYDIILSQDRHVTTL